MRDIFLEEKIEQANEEIFYMNIRDCFTKWERKEERRE